MEEESITTTESEKPYTREQLVTAVDNLKVELEKTGRTPTEMEDYGIKHALTHYDKAFPSETENPAK